jgi:16S rRNA (adenine1518-N6/adenine1519-N6)-dimethyltransferase
MLRKSLQGLPGALDALEALGINSERRAETLNVAEFAAIARTIGG